MFLTSNNAEYSLPYFIKNLKAIYRYIDYIDLNNFAGKYELNVYLNKYNKYIYKQIMDEETFNRINIKNGKICAIFRATETKNKFVEIIYLSGINGLTKKELIDLYEQQKTLAA